MCIQLQELTLSTISELARRALEPCDDSEFWLITGILAGKLPSGHPCFVRLWAAAHEQPANRGAAELECELLTAWKGGQ